MALDSESACCELMVESLSLFCQGFHPLLEHFPWQETLSQGSSIYLVTYLLEPPYPFSPISPFSSIRASSIIQIIQTKASMLSLFSLIYFDLIQLKFAEPLLSMWNQLGFGDTEVSSI